MSCSFLVALRAETSRTRSPRSTWTTTSSVPSAIPRRTMRASPWCSRSSSHSTANTSRNADVANSKPTPCLRRLATAFAASHSNSAMSTGFPYLRQRHGRGVAAGSRAGLPSHRLARTWLGYDAGASPRDIPGRVLRRADEATGDGARLTSLQDCPLGVIQAPSPFSMTWSASPRCSMVSSKQPEDGARRTKTTLDRYLLALAMRGPMGPCPRLRSGDGRECSHARG